MFKKELQDAYRSAINYSGIRSYEKDSITLGLNFMGHDNSYTLLDGNGIPILIAEEERYSRVKKGTFIPSPKQVFEVLEEAGIRKREIRHIAIANIQELVEHRTPETLASYIPFGMAKCCNALFRAISREFSDVDSVEWIRHHLCHAASAFLPSPFETAAVLTVDGMGENETATIWYGKGTQLTKLYSVRHPHSLGYIYQAVSQWAGMTGAEREGKLMGLASYGEPRFLSVFYKHFIHLIPEGGFTITPELASKPCNNASWIDYCETHLGPRRKPHEELTSFHKDIAASVQVLLEETLLHLLHLASKLSTARHCCMAGGVFMNSMANGRLRREGPFKDIWVQPMSKDNGLSLGAALLSYTRRHPERGRWQMTHPFWGSDITNEKIQLLLNRHLGPVHLSNNVEGETAKLLAAGKLVGWVQGRSEVGARALGHRSILADPRVPSTKDRLNTCIKLREDWRPFAPIVLEEDAGLFFLDSRPSAFMTFVSPVRPNVNIPAAIHVDGTGRLQTVNKEFDTRVYNLLQEFKKLTGISVLVNTSFNLKGEPIVRTVEEAYYDFINSGMDVLVLGDYIFEKPSLYEWKGIPTAPLPRIRVSNNLSKIVQSEKQIAIVSLGSQQFFDTVKKCCNKAFESRQSISFFLPPDAGSIRYPMELNELTSIKGDYISILALGSYNAIFILLPTWVQVAIDLVPNLLYHFIELSKNKPSIKIFVLDEFGSMENLSTISYKWDWSGPRGMTSEVEHFWLFHRNGNKCENTEQVIKTGNEDLTGIVRRTL